MSGSYTAKPPIDVIPDVPSGWNIIWSYPGPPPPGYTPIYSLTLSAPETIYLTDPTALVSLSLYDHISYATNEPTGKISWVVNKTYSSSPSSSFSSIEGIYGSSGNFVFTNLEDGDIIEITATSEAFDGFILSQTVQINVEAGVSVDVWTLDILADINLDASRDGAGSSGATAEDSYGSASISAPDPGTVEYLGEWSSNSFEKNDIVLDSSDESIYFYISVSADCLAGSPGTQHAEADISETFRVYKNGVLQTTHTSSVSVSIDNTFPPSTDASDSETCEVHISINSGTGAVTITETIT